MLESIKQAVATGDTTARPLDGRDFAGASRERRRVSLRDIPPELSFLSAHGVGADVLLEATRSAIECGASADDTLLGGGLAAEEAYYRALARHLRVPFFDGEFAFDDTLDPAKAIASGIAPLKPNASGLRAVVAPRGASIRYLIAAAAKGRSLAGLAVTPPRRLGQLVRAGAGAKVAAAAVGDLRRRDPSFSAYSGPSWLQSRRRGGGDFSRSHSRAARPGLVDAAISATLWAVFAAWIVLRNLAVAAAADRGVAAPPQPDEKLPVYSIVAALYREENMVAKLVGAFEALDYPRAKLDIKLVIEADDAATLAAIQALDLPPRYETIVAPPGEPRTKPRALNVALPAVRGELIVVYDAEDTPDPDQLRLAAARFAADPHLDCLQARLTIENAGETWISRMFAIEYAALFDLINPGLTALDMPIALGGTSNHFHTRTLRRVGGWDAWNVTEDADLGVRLARHGARVGALCSETREEAPTCLSVWFKQRVRWQKGWMQTLIVHSRRPGRILRELGPARTAAAAAMIGGSVLGGLFGPALTADALIRAASGALATASPLRVAGDVAIYTLMISGLLTVLAPAWVAGRRRGLIRGCDLAILPLYYVMVSAASWIALIDLTVRPFYWAKTEHGSPDERPAVSPPRSQP